MNEALSAGAIERQRAEKKAFDEWALLGNRLAADDQLVIDPLDYLSCRSLHKAALRLLGRIEGKKILDCGCGSGEMSVILAKYGAQVIGCDISIEQIRLAQHRAVVNGVAGRCSFVPSPLEELPFVEGEFDMAFGAFILHHVACLEKTAQNISRCLKPSGKAVFIETVAINPVLMFARRYVAGRFGIRKFGTDTERPLTRKQINAFARPFSRYGVIYPKFAFFGFIPTYIFHNRKRLQRTSAALFNLDERVERRLPRFRKYTYWWVLEFMK